MEDGMKDFQDEMDKKIQKKDGKNVFQSITFPAQILQLK